MNKHVGVDPRILQSGVGGFPLDVGFQGGWGVLLLFWAVKEEESTLKMC
jgi:hypothetical protein